jgi:hypothetical protein
MSDDIEQRLTAAAAAVREREVTTRRCADLQGRQDTLLAEVAALRAKSALENEDVDRLEGLSLTRVLAALAGAREERLGRERAEADAARFRVAEAEARLAAIQHDHDLARQRLDGLAGAPDAYAAALAEKERYLTREGDQRGRRLLALAEERGRLAGELKEAREALQAADAATQALSRVRDRLDSASGWSTYDTFFGGGAMASVVKHERMDEAARAAAEADQRLAVLRTELADVGEPGLTAPQLTIGDGTKFVDVWFDNFFTDMAVRDRINQARQNVDNSADLVDQVGARLQNRLAGIGARLAAIEAERRDLLAE